jgi:hypothetical protein
VLMSVHLPNSKVGYLLTGRSKLGHLLRAALSYSVSHSRTYVCLARRSQASFCW